MLMRIKMNKKIYLPTLMSFMMACSCSSTEERSKDSSNKTMLKDTHGQETLVAHTFIWEQGNFETQNWKAPDYSNQEGRIGWSADSFTVPKGLEVNVNFWKDIYQKYSSDEGVVHDSYHIDLVYEVVDFRPIMRDASLSNAQKLKKRRQMVDGIKRKVKRAISAIRNGHKLDDYAKELKNKISKYKEKNILRELPQKGRLRFQLGQKDYIRRGLFHSGAYMDDIEQIFAQYNLPRQLARLPFVESSFNLKAKSKVGASGIWQIMPATARGKLARNHFYDYRNHPLEAAHVAAKLLAYNYRVLEDWPRAVTAYNYGAAGIRRLSRKLGTSDISEMAKKRHRRWGFAASNFYASYLAFLDTEQKAGDIHGPEFKIRKPLNYHRLKLTKNIGWNWLQEELASSWEDFQALNPQFRHFEKDKYAMLKKGLVIYLPVKSKEEFLDSYDKAKSFYPKYDYRIHRVSRGENLSLIARKYRVSVNSIIRMNQLSNRGFIRAGQNLKVPIPLNR
jgi:membrane-bound lytic murein transglycosylase D